MQGVENPKIRIFIIEDEVKYRKQLLNFFREDKEIEVCGCLPGNENIIPKIEFYKPDIILIDFLARNYSGKRILCELNSLRFDFEFKIIVMSSLQSVWAMEKSFRAGISYYINKPIIFAMLREAVKKVYYFKVESEKIEEDDV